MVSKKEKTAPVAVVMGSDSDMEVMQNCIEQLGYFGIGPVPWQQKRRCRSSGCRWFQVPDWRGSMRC